MTSIATLIELDEPIQRRSPRTLLLKMLILVAILALWEGIVRFFKVPEVLVPSPLSVAQALYQGFVVAPNDPTSLIPPTWQTFWKSLTGLFLGSILGLGLAIVLSHIRVVEQYAMSYITAFQSMPKVAIAPLLIVWFGFGAAPTLVLVTASCFFPILINGLEGFKSTDTDRIDLLRSLGATRGQIFRVVVLPSALPFVFSGLQIGLVTCLLSTIVGEFVNARDGLGARILYANNVLDVAEVFAVMIILGCMAALFDFVIRRVRGRVLFWSPGERSTGK